jgi:hypothetical protein
MICLSPGLVQFMCLFLLMLCFTLSSGRMKRKGSERHFCVERKRTSVHWVTWSTRSSLWWEYWRWIRSNCDSSGFKRAVEFSFCVMLKWLVWKIIFIDTKARGLILINRNLVGLHEKHAVGTWNFENHLNICLQTANIRQMFAYAEFKMGFV